MSISNYGTRMRYDGIDIMVPIDPGLMNLENFDDVQGIYKTSSWELPLILDLEFL